jgi:peptidoglycan/LPS O-acetylase OafA/YrhL
MTQDATSTLPIEAGTTTSGRVLPMDSMRGIAALGVTLFWHYSHFGPYRPFDGFLPYWLYRYGLMFVDFFFVLSGFVLSHAYLQKLSERRVSPYQFFVLRFSRLYPLHLVTLLFVAAMQGVRHSIGLEAFVYTANDLKHFLLNLVFLQQGLVRTVYSYNGPAWSLTVEEVSYFLFFGAMFFFARYRKLAFSALLLLGVAISYAGWDTHFFNLSISRGLVGFFAGCLAYQLHSAANRAGRGSLLALVCGVLVVGIVTFYVTNGYPRSNPTLLIHSLVIFPGIVLTVLNVPLLTALMSLRPLAYLGEISYSVYMIHFPAQLMLATADEFFGWGWYRGSLSFFALYAVSTLLLSAASFHFFERRAQAALRHSLLK